MPIWQQSRANQLGGSEYNFRCLKRFFRKVQRNLRSAFFLKLRFLKIRLLVTWLKCLLRAYLDPWQTSKMEHFEQNAPSSMFDKVLNIPPRLIRKSAYTWVSILGNTQVFQHTQQNLPKGKKKETNNQTNKQKKQAEPVTLLVQIMHLF